MSQTYAEVGDFGQYLLHPENRRRLSFGLREAGYAPERAKFPPSGWRYRRARIMYERAYEEQVSIERTKRDRSSSDSSVAETAVPAAPPNRDRARRPLLGYRGCRSLCHAGSGGTAGGSDDPAIDGRHPGDRRVQSAAEGRQRRSA